MSWKQNQILGETPTLRNNMCISFSADALGSDYKAECADFDCGLCSGEATWANQACCGFTTVDTVASAGLGLAFVVRALASPPPMSLPSRSDPSHGAPASSCAMAWLRVLQHWGRMHVCSLQSCWCVCCATGGRCSDLIRTFMASESPGTLSIGEQQGAARTGALSADTLLRLLRRAAVVCTDQRRRACCAGVPCGHDAAPLCRR